MNDRKICGDILQGKMRLIRRVIRYVIVGYTATIFVCIFVPENDDESNQLC